MNIVVVDLEWNGAPLYSTGGYFNEIIEIGAIKLNDSLEMVSTYQALVKPCVHKRLTGRVKRLTHISNDEVRSARGFDERLREFREWIGNETTCIMSWGTSDVLVWLENLERFHYPKEMTTADYYCDAQVLCQSRLGIERSKQPGLSTVAEMLNMPCENMEMHRALDDSIVTANCLRRLWDEKLFCELRSPADDKFINKLTFKTVTLCDLRNPMIDMAMFTADCPECGQPLEQKTDIIARSRCFRAEYFCAQCRKSYIVKHVLRLRYEGLEHKRSIREKLPPVPEDAGEAAHEDGVDVPPCDSVIE